MEEGGWAKHTSSMNILKIKGSILPSQVREIAVKEVKSINFIKNCRACFHSQRKVRSLKIGTMLCMSSKKRSAKSILREKSLFSLTNFPGWHRNAQVFWRLWNTLWNQHFSRMDNIILIVCGSAANWIIRKSLITRVVYMED